MIRIAVFAALIFATAGAAAGQTLFDAIASKDKSAVERLLAAGAEVDGRGPGDKQTPLIAAALAGDAEIAALLLAKGADIMARNVGGFTPLHAAAYAGSMPVAELLLEKGAKLEDDENKARVSPLMVAGEEHHLKLAEFFIARGADVNHAEIHGFMPVSRALWKRNDDVVRLLKRHGATCQEPPVKSDADYERCLAITE